MANKKPTMKQVKNVIDNVLIHISNMQGQLNRLESVTASYIEFKKDNPKFNKWLKTKLEEAKKNDNNPKDLG
tara:strand:- start:257 stop:472 length:216 start_codon:yes stop_codon:yes gene_type:complete